MTAGERPTDGPDTELAAISADLDDLHTEACSVAMRSEGSLIADAEEVRDDVASIRDRLRAVLARPAAGRDLTADEVVRAMQAWRTGRVSFVEVTDELNRIARPAVARTDGQPPADVRDEIVRLAVAWRWQWKHGSGNAAAVQLADAVDRLSAAPAEDTAGQAHPLARGERIGRALTTLRSALGLHHDEVAARAGMHPQRLGALESGAEPDVPPEWIRPVLAALAAPADDTVAPDPDHTTEYRAVMTGYGTGSHGDLDSLRRVYRPQIESGEIWIESRTVSPWIRVPDAGQPVRDSQGGGA